MKDDLVQTRSISQYVAGLDKKVDDCNFCGGALVVESTYPSVVSIQLPDLPAAIMDGKLLLDHELSIRGRTYLLAGIIYRAHNHFSCRYVEGTGDVYSYDGILNNGVSSYDGSLLDGLVPLSQLSYSGVKTACLAVYRMT
jgi:hypothetical protein